MMKKFMYPLAILMIAILAACGGEIDTGALVDQASEAAQQGLDAAQEAIDSAVEEEAAVEEPVIEEVVVAVPANQLTIDDVIGSYTFHDPSNDWHYVEITRDEDVLKWTNKADVSWTLTPDFENNSLLTDDSFPYQGEFQNFELVIEDGNYAGLISNGDLWVYNSDSVAPFVASTALWAGNTVVKGGDPLADVNIAINSVESQSGADGSFEMSVSASDDGRYVINSAKEGYLPLSIIHIGSAPAELTLEFQPVETFIVDPTQPIDTTDSRGTNISIEPNSLVDTNGNPATEDLTLSTYTYDLTAEEMVGDMSGTNTEGEEVFMESAGAFYAEFEDDDGNEYNLAPDAEAEISIPAERKSPNEVLTVWSYNAETGLWEEEGEAELVDGRYVAKVSHFSYWNFDWEKSAPACIKLEIEQSYLTENTPVQVKAVLQTNPVTVRDMSITDQANVLHNLPTNTDVQFFMPPNAATPFATANSGTPWGGTGVPAFPYDACNGQAEIAPAAPTSLILQSVNFPDRYLAVNFDGTGIELLPVSPESDDALKQRATFMQVPGLADASRVSLQTNNGGYVVATPDGVTLQAAPDTDELRRAATFNMIKGLAGTG
ncbi:MAG: hypothetical protein ACI9EW_003762, partial [Cellvibrionaceae bacterium]